MGETYRAHGTEKCIYFGLKSKTRKQNSCKCKNHITIYLIKIGFGVRTGFILNSTGEIL